MCSARSYGEASGWSIRGVLIVSRSPVSFSTLLCALEGISLSFHLSVDFCAARLVIIELETWKGLQKNKEESETILLVCAKSSDYASRDECVCSMTTEMLIWNRFVLLQRNDTNRSLDVGAHTR